MIVSLILARGSVIQIIRMYSYTGMFVSPSLASKNAAQLSLMIVFFNTANSAAAQMLARRFMVVFLANSLANRTAAQMSEWSLSPGTGMSLLAYLAELLLR